MRFKADLHIHTDNKLGEGRGHGEDPRKAAQGIVDANLDIYAISEHNAVSERLFQVAAEIEELTSKTQRQILALFGMETSFRFEDLNFHGIYTFEEQFNPLNIPRAPERHTTLDEIEQFKRDYPGTFFVAHPMWRPRITRYRQVVPTLLQHPVVDGIEVLNGAILRHSSNRQPITRGALEMLKQAHISRPTLAAIGASDAHTQDIIGMAHTEFDGGNPMEIFDRIRSGETAAIADHPRVAEEVRKAIAAV